MIALSNTPPPHTQAQVRSRDPDSTTSQSNHNHPSRKQEVEKALGPGNYRPIARRSGLDPRSVSRVLRGLTGRGQRTITLETATKICLAAGVTLDEMREYIESQVYGKETGNV